MEACTLALLGNKRSRDTGNKDPFASSVVSSPLRAARGWILAHAMSSCRPVRLDLFATREKIIKSEDCFGAMQILNVELRIASCRGLPMVSIHYNTTIFL
mmetsp:Transcript_18294/g.41972  ORF Transcript_18294/g.41972 Transcript_18294/m.41972 type:complete len:100 (-) Transcript_18294:33-332(-)